MDETLMRDGDDIAVGMIARELIGSLEPDETVALDDIRALFDFWPEDRRWELVESLAGLGAAFALAAAQHQNIDPIQYVRGVAEAIGASIAAMGASGG